MENTTTQLTEMTDTAIKALETFIHILKQKKLDLDTYEPGHHDIKELNSIFKMNIKDMAIESKSVSDDISDDAVVEFISYVNNIKV